MDTATSVTRHAIAPTGEQTHTSGGGSLFKIQFDDSLTSTYEYPSETSLLETNGFDDADSGPESAGAGTFTSDNGLLSHSNKLLSSVPLAIVLAMLGQLEPQTTRWQRKNRQSEPNRQRISNNTSGTNGRTPVVVQHHQRHGAVLKRVPIGVGVKATMNPPIPEYRGVLALHSAPYGNHVGGIYFANPSVASDVTTAIDTSFELGVTRTPSPSAASTASSTGSSSNGSHTTSSNSSHTHSVTSASTGADSAHQPSLFQHIIAATNGNGFGPGHHPQKQLDRPNNNNSLHSNGHNGDSAGIGPLLLNGDTAIPDSTAGGGLLCGGTGEPESIQYLKPASDEQTVNWSQGTRVTDLLF
ncbi:hypothetical protein AND_002415 [Anopheles darlingi]|uniref:Uncharacterized protein n=1 Tax=Anopheles darlingi TaxID=43151 RepID=W5JSB7_ANODA|nr:hypothetical protein AND_002415 [Anopheles darlingi]